MIKKSKGCAMCGKPLFRTTAKVCSVNCSLEYNLKYPEKVKNYLQEIQEKEWKKKRKVIKDKLKTLSDLEGEAKKEFQKWIRKRDTLLPCISCGANSSPIWDAGHWHSADKYSGLIFLPENVHKQCRACNFFKSGNERAYRVGLIERYGEQYVLNIEAIADKLRQYKYTREELISIKKMYQEKNKTL